MGEAKEVLATTIIRKAHQFGINTSDYRLPLDVNVGIEVNSNRVVEELNYDNNRLMHPVRITAPDLAVEIIAPRYTTPTKTTMIGIQVTNRGEVGSNAATLSTASPVNRTRQAQSRRLCQENRRMSGSTRRSLSASTRTLRSTRGVTDYETRLQTTALTPQSARLRAR